MAEQLVVGIDWHDALPRACSGTGVRAVHQPLVDLARGVVVGYEALVRFGDPDDLTPDRWFAAARDAGCAEVLEAVALDTTLRARDDLPPDCFLAVNLAATSLRAPQVRDRLAAEPHLHGVVLELTDADAVAGSAELAALVEEQRLRGAALAIDHPGASDAGLATILELRPDVLKLDREQIAGVDRYEVKRALIEMLLMFAGHVDAQVVAEAIETPEELEALRRLGIAVGQGWVLGRPAPAWTGPTAQARSVLGTPRPKATDAEEDTTARAVLEPARWIPVDRPDAAIASSMGADRATFVVMVDDDGSPVAAVSGRARPVHRPVPVLRVVASTSVVDLVRRALTRPAPRRFDPVVVVDATGRLLGIARLDRALAWLAERAG